MPRPRWPARQGPVRVLGAVRLLAEPGDAAAADVALAGGVALRLTRHIALAADVASLTDREPGEQVAWSAGVSLAIPHTPHTLSLHATNTNNATLQSSSRGTGETRYGFEFTIPVTLSRYFGSARHRPPRRRRGARRGAARTRRDPTRRRPWSRTSCSSPADSRSRPARTVVWTNGGQVAHTVTAEDGSFDSGPIEAGQQRAITFSAPGTYTFHCTPHPFMRGEIVVR